MTDFVNLKIYPYKKMKIYSASFKSLSDMHMYIKGDPEVNSKIFIRQHSIISRASYVEDTFEKAVDYLIGGYTGDYDIALKMQRELEKNVIIKESFRKRERSMTGSHPNVPAYVAGVPKSMYKLTRLPEKRFVSIWFNLAYPVYTSRHAVTNRGALTLSLIKLLEAHGIGVDLRVFNACYCRGEIFICEIRLKSPSEQINGKKCFYPLCSVMFLRRIILRIMESMSFEEADWYPNYGEPLSEEQFRSIFGIPDSDIVISSPTHMGILGDDISTDGERFFKRIELEKYIEIKNEQRKAVPLGLRDTKSGYNYIVSTPNGRNGK